MWSTSVCGACPLQAVVEIAELLDLAPAEVQDTLSFYGFFRQDAAARRNEGLGLPFDQLRAAWGRGIPGRPSASRPVCGQGVRRPTGG